MAGTAARRRANTPGSAATARRVVKVPDPVPAAAVVAEIDRGAGVPGRPAARDRENRQGTPRELVARRALAMCTALRALALVLFATVALTGAARRPTTVFDLSDAVGKRVPALTLVAGDGTPVVLAERGKPTYIFLFAGWCGPCQEAMPFVRNAHAKYGDRVRFIGVDVLEDAQAARSSIGTAALPFPVATYPIDQLDAVVAPAVQLRAGMKYRIPTDFLVDADGVVRFAWHGLAMNNSGDPVDLLPGYLAKLGIE